MPRGRIVKALSGFYYVESEEELYQCRGRGNFRNRSITPLVGDWVEFDAENKTDGYVMSIEERSNELVRPPIANVDQAVLVFSVKEPEFSTYLLDKLLVHTESNGISAVICLTKTDLGLEDKTLDKIQEYEKIGYEVIYTTKDNKSPVEKLLPVLENKVSVFAGQSGVGKSSLLNVIDPGLNIETDIISKSLGRGKHTTRHVELVKLTGGGYVADTPGFSSLDFRGISSGILSHFYPEMAALINDCKYRGCTHINEPKCAVKKAVDDGSIAEFRYESYTQFYQEIQSQKRRY
ncbi:ribosome small subunit-dependent GTPase A [Alkalicoccus halolimnae]|uniref:Small ribosomal subunit biogenesis GTPase RsgA n=1 Tax=Alkalicoccus halolimnae TaxID=1667239 RepID=A0A5C7FPU1_9BACI|nr:ribosome small subunit-dependent GTPase A [Alkalicoccus halolimnae]TXF87386.1 ribosome small subunit-dependent GTPase A [Alkalicoccus halolimnae]